LISSAIFSPQQTVANRSTRSAEPRPRPLPPIVAREDFKYIDIVSRSGTDHLILVDGTGIHYLDTTTELPYARQLIADIRHRTETAMSQAHCFKAMELAFNAQAMAERNAGAAK
jgi:hypothetical protein